MPRRKVRKTLGVDPSGNPIWLSINVKKNPLYEMIDMQDTFRTPTEIAVECVTTLNDLFNTHPEVVIQIQDRLKF